MAKSNNLASMSVDALLKLRDEVVNMLNRKADDLKRQLSRLSTDKAKGAKRPAARKARGPAKGGKVAPKYRGPGGETWSGRGLKPRWLTEALNNGHTAEEFLIAQSGSKKASAKRGRKRKAA